MRPSYLCKIIIRRHIVVVDNNDDIATAAAAAGNDAPAPSNSVINNRNNRYDTDHVYYHHVPLPTITFASGSETWARFLQYTFQTTVIETSTSSRLLPLLVQLHPFQQRVTAYRLRFGYGYATIVFPTWTWKQQQQPCGENNGKNDDDNGDNGIVDALLEVNVSIISCQPEDHNRNSTTSMTTPSYFKAHETILDSIGVNAYSTTTFLNLHYQTLLGDAFSPPPYSTTPFPVVKARTNVYYCIEDEFFPGRIADYELIVGKNGTRSNRDGNDAGGSGGSNGRSGGDVTHEYILPKTVITGLSLEGGSGINRDSSSSSSSSGGGVGASSGSIVIDHQTINDQTNIMTKASSNESKNARKDDARVGTIGDNEDLVDGVARCQGDVDHANEDEIHNESADITAANTIAKTTASTTTVGVLEKNATKKEKRRKRLVKESATPLPSDKMPIPPSPARSTVVLDVEASPYSDKRRKVDTNDKKQNDLIPRNTSKEGKAKDVANQLSAVHLESDKHGGTALPKPNIHPAVKMIANELEGSLQEMEKLPITEKNVNIHHTAQNNTARELDDAMSTVIKLNSPLVESQPNQGSATAAAVQLEKIHSEPSKKKSNIHTSSEKNARDLANAVAAEQKRAFGVQNRVACRARGLADHNSNTAYIVIPESVKHGDELLCSHPICRISKKFLYCQHCKIPITKRNRSKHRHGEELKRNSNDNQNGVDARDQKISMEGNICQLVGNVEEGKMTEKTKKKTTKTKLSNIAPIEPKLPSFTTKTEKKRTAYTSYIEEVRPIFEKLMD